jgi:HAE1 family hydrophobic/amphiphilic exporter-1
MGQAVIGGLITSTLLTLFVVPVVYTILDDFSLKKVFGFAFKAAASLRPEKTEPHIDPRGVAPEAK